MIEKVPLQIYRSALIFAPEMSIIRGQFEDQIPDWIFKLPKVQRDWSSLEQTLEGHLSRPGGAVGIIWVYIGIIVKNDGALKAGK
jgi:hypothetical protein